MCPIFTNPPDLRKALSNGVKTHLFKLKVLSCVGKKMIPRRGGGELLKCTIYTPGSPFPSLSFPFTALLLPIPGNI